MADRAGGLTAARLLGWGDLEERRRRAAGVGRLRWPLRVAAGGALAALVAIRAGDDPGAAATLARATIVVLYAIVMVGAPFRMFWRPDAPLLARLPVAGGALFDVALVRQARAASAAAVVALPAVAALAVASPELAARHAALWAVVAAAAALLLPAVALAAGAIVAGDKARALFAAAGGGDAPLPATGWLGGLPGLAAAAVVIAALALVGWTEGATTTIVGSPAVLLAGLPALSLAAALAARAAAPAVMPLAVREVAALDLQRLAHLEIHPPTALERAVGARLPGRARLVHAKDARLVRRRYPLALLAGATTTVALWIVAGVRPAAPWPWVLAIGGAFAAYGQLVARRLATPPVELPFVRTLPVTEADRSRAKLAYLATWAALYPALGAIPLAWTLGPAVAAAAAAAGAVTVAVAAATGAHAPRPAA